MLKTLKWIYELGKAHERRRIEKAIADYRRESTFHPVSEKERLQQEDEDREIESIIHALVYPRQTEFVEIQKSILDE